MEKEHVLEELLSTVNFSKSGSKPIAFKNALQVFIVWKCSHQKRPSQVGK